MTIVVGLIDQGNGRIYMGADSVGSNGNAYVFKNRKIIILQLKRPYWSNKHGDQKENASILVGVSGSYRASQLVEAMDVPEWPKGKSSYHYLIGPFVTAVRQALIDGGAMGKNGDQMDRTDLTMLVALDDCLFVIWQDFSVTQPSDEYAAIGKGTDLALGSLFATRGGTDPYLRVLEALRAAAAYDDSCGAPFIVTSTDGTVIIADADGVVRAG